MHRHMIVVAAAVFAMAGCGGAEKSARQQTACALVATACTLCEVARGQLCDAADAGSDGGGEP